MSLHTAWLSLGSNIDARANIRSAMEALARAFRNVSFSPAYTSPAVGFEGDDFINLAARADTDLGPMELSRWLQELESLQGRDRSGPRWSSRTLDVDILLYDDLWLISPTLEIPRKEILSMAHVLKPLADLAPDLVHPMEGVTMGQLWARFPQQDSPLNPITL